MKKCCRKWRTVAQLLVGRDDVSVVIHFEYQIVMHKVYMHQHAQNNFIIGNHFKILPFFICLESQLARFIMMDHLHCFDDSLTLYYSDFLRHNNNNNRSSEFNNKLFACAHSIKKKKYQCHRCYFGTAVIIHLPTYLGM